jgi:DNA helicase II / ATP-dependent DNA helicase PcrA
MTWQPPVEFGRGVVVLPDDHPPPAWSSCPRILIDDSALEDIAPVVEELHRYWFNRRPVVVELGLDPALLREPESSALAVYDHAPGFEFSRERLQFLVWANNYDARGGDRAGARGGDPIWWHGRKAARRFADEGVAEGGLADIELADGTPLFVDGGPPQSPLPAAGTGVVHRWNAENGRLDLVGRAPSMADLAADQLAAVGHLVGPARVIAPAGSGKTRVLTERLRHLVSDRHVHPGAITALAYNSKAAAELRVRCADIEGAHALNIRTLNSLGLWICNEFGRSGVLGHSGRLRVLEEPAVRDLLQQQIEIRRQANTDTVAPYLEALSAIRLGLTAPALVEETMPDAAGIAEGFVPYRAALADLGAVDFDEQIYRALEILLTDPEARSSAQAKCRYLLVDEFQDLNPAHLLLIRLLAAPTYDCFGVGDDDQVIYGYSGATPEYLINFDRYFPGAATHPLTVNYRCPPAVIGAARHVLSYNARRIEKEIHAPPGRIDGPAEFGGPLANSGAVAVLHAPADALAGLAVATISSWRQAGVDPNDIAVLSRVNSALLPVQVACMEAGVPCSTPLTTAVLQRTGIRTAFAYLRIGSDPHHIRREDILETIRRPSRGIAPKVVDMLTSRPTTSITDIRRLAGRLSGRDVPKLGTYASDLDTVVRGCRTSSGAALKAIRVEVGLGDTMDVLDSSRSEADRSTHTDDLAALESVAALHPEVATFEAWLRHVLSRTAGEGPQVLLSTIHRIKGREWDHVVIFDVSRGLFPHRLGNDEEGERRVFHVALTRARTQVVVLADADAPSIFVAELDGSRSPVAPGSSDASRQLGATNRPSRGTPRNDRASRNDRGDRGDRRARKPSVFAEVQLPVVEAAVGLVIEHRGTLGTVVEVTEGTAILLTGAVKQRVSFGSDVRVEGQSVTLVGPGLGAGTGAAEADEAEKALRTWRSATASLDAVPAYVILKDAELAGIAARHPSTLAELAQCRGIGHIKLERWGDEILSILETVRQG